jgi:acetyltransferase-like isoleucine patch superfamily enzyme
MPMKPSIPVQPDLAVTPRRPVLMSSKGPAGSHHPIVALVLRIQGSAFIRPSLRRRLLNWIGASIHTTAVIEHSCWLSGPLLRMGAGSRLNVGARLDCSTWITLEDEARVGMEFMAITRTHQIEASTVRRNPESPDLWGEIVIGRGCWLGARVTVLPGVTIAAGCVVGATTTIIHSTEPDGLYLNAIGASGSIYGKRTKDL